MSTAKETAKKEVDVIDPFLETVVRSAAGRSVEPKAPGKAKATPNEDLKKKAGATKAQPSKAVASNESKEDRSEDAANEANLMARVEAKLKSRKSAVSRSVTIRMPGDLYDRLSEQAWGIGERSLSKFVITVLQEATK
jgi:hypothetical protein